jgi:hypothetical protein
MPFRWVGPQTGRIDPHPAEAVLEDSSAALQPAGARRHLGESLRGYLEPDATLIRDGGPVRVAC